MLQCFLLKEVTPLWQVDPQLVFLAEVEEEVWR